MERGERGKRRENIEFRSKMRNLFSFNDNYMAFISLFIKIIELHE